MNAEIAIVVEEPGVVNGVSPTIIPFNRLPNRQPPIIINMIIPNPQ